MNAHILQQILLVFKVQVDSCSFILGTDRLTWLLWSISNIVFIVAQDGYLDLFPRKASDFVSPNDRQFILCYNEN